MRDMAVKFGVSASTVQKYRTDAGLKTFVAQKVPKRSEKQESVAITRARKLYQHCLPYFDCILMDDETYCKVDFKQLPGKKFYTATKKGNVKEKFKEVKSEKFAAKYMVWQAICSCGLKTDTFVTNGSINATVYIKECLQKRILPFIGRHRGSVLFWPDLATSHYAGQTIKWFEENGVQFVPKDCNPPNTPMLRPIERYWALMKRELKKRGGVAKDIKYFKKRWNEMSKTIDEMTVQNLMRGIKKNVKKFYLNKK